MSPSWTGCQWHLCLVPGLSGAMAYITVWQGDAARRKHAGFQRLIIVFDFSVCSADFIRWGRQQCRILTYYNLLFPSAE